MTAPAAELRNAFQLAAELPDWADGFCAAVERETAAGQLGEAAVEWIRSTSGLTRLLLATTLRDMNAGPAGMAVTALALIYVRNMIRTMRRLLPAGNFDMLKNPLVAPSLLTDFLDRH
jgi:hypothetical protein